jgi:hypothetical protein
MIIKARKASQCDAMQDAFLPVAASGRDSAWRNERSFVSDERIVETKLRDARKKQKDTTRTRTGSRRTGKREKW